MDAPVVSGRLRDDGPGDRAANRIVRWQAWVLLGGYFLVHRLAHASYEAQAVEFPARQQFLFTLSLVSFLWYWLSEECRDRRFPLDMGLFLLLAWWALLPYYLWKSQRWAGLGKIALLGVLWTATYLFARVLSWLL